MSFEQVQVDEKMYIYTDTHRYTHTHTHHCCYLLATSCPTLVIACTIVCQAPLLIGFSRHGESRILLQNTEADTEAGCHFLLQGIFLTQELNLCLLHWQADSLLLSHQGSPWMYITCTYICIHTHLDSYFPGLTFKILGKTFCLYKSKTAYQRIIGGLPMSWFTQER